MNLCIFCNGPVDPPAMSLCRYCFDEMMLEKENDKK